MPRRQPAHPRMVKPSGPRRSAPEVELCIPVIDEESTKGRRISMMITMHLLMDAPKSTLGPIGRLGDDLHDAHQAMASNMLGFIRNHWEGGYCIRERNTSHVESPARSHTSVKTASNAIAYSLGLHPRAANSPGSSSAPIDIANATMTLGWRRTDSSNQASAVKD